MVPTTPASSAASRSAAWLCERRASVEPLGNVHLFPPLVFTSRNSTAAACLRKQTAATCNGSDFETRAEPMGESPANMLLARYFTNVKVQQILCSRNGYERVTSVRYRPAPKTGIAAPVTSFPA